MALKTFLTTAAAAALLAGSAVAQETTTGAETDTQAGAETPLTPNFADIRDMTVGDATGWAVYDSGGNKIGEIDQVVQGPDGAAGVIGVGGFLGIGEHTVAIPLADFELGAEGASFTLNMDKETLEAQPEFDEAAAEGLPDETSLADLLEAEAGADTDAEAEAETGAEPDTETGDEAGMDDS